MTVREKVADMLVDNGLWPEEAKTVMETVAQAPESEAMKGVWNKDASGYPAPLFNVLFLTAKTHAIAYLEANKPKHFALNILKG